MPNIDKILLKRDGFNDDDHVLTALWDDKNYFKYENSGLPNDYMGYTYVTQPTTLCLCLKWLTLEMETIKNNAVNIHKPNDEQQQGRRIVF